MGVVTGPRGPLLNFWALSKTRELGIAKYKYGVLINHGDYWRMMGVILRVELRRYHERTF